MKIACLSDAHLGYRGPGRTEGGRSVREMDVERAWAAAVDAICASGAELVLIAGDVFDSVTPSTHAKIAYLNGLRRLAEGSHVVVIGGNHETPRTAAVASPNDLGRGLASNVHIVRTPGTIVRLRLSADVAIHCFPFDVLGGESVFTPTPDGTDLDILLIHGAVRSSARPDALPKVYGGPGSYDVALAEGFDIVACGDFHEFEVLCGAEPIRNVYGALDLERHGFTSGPVAFYSGALERVTSNPWEEYGPKGWVLVDTVARELQFYPVPIRSMMDLDGEPYDDTLSMAERVNLAMADALASPYTDNALVRLRVDNFPRAEMAAVDHDLVRALQQHAVHFRLDLRQVGRAGVEGGDRRHVRRSLAEAVDALLADEPPPVAEIVREQLGMQTTTEVSDG